MGFKMIIKRKSILSGIEYTRDIPVNPEDMLVWETGSVNIQDAMPYLNDNDREFILTGITSEEWEGAFKEMEDIL